MTLKGLQHAGKTPAISQEERREREEGKREEGVKEGGEERGELLTKSARDKLAQSTILPCHWSGLPSW